MSNPLLVIAGAGPGVGAAVARRFGAAGYDVGLIARSPDRLQALGDQLQDLGITVGWAAADLTDRAALAAAVTRLVGPAEHLDQLHFNPSATTMKSPLELSPEELLADLDLGVASLLTAVQAARPFLPAGGRVTATGSMAADHPWSAAASLGVQKAGLRNLVAALDTELAPSGVRAMSLTVRGTLAAGTAFDPDRVAEGLFRASRAAGDETWRTEVPFEGAINEASNGPDR